MSGSSWLSLLLGVIVLACDYPRPPDVPDDDAPAEAGIPIDADGSAIDANGPAIDGAPVDGRPVLALNCTTYCDTIQAACTGANAQYPDSAHCTGTCNLFTPGASTTETMGDTLGCRIYHAQNATLMAGAASTHCPHAGPVGAASDAATGVCSTDPCSAFCALDVKVCGTDDAPVVGISNRYANLGACMTACAAFAKTPPYSATSPSGNTFACRIYHVTNAAAAASQANSALVNTHCGHTLSPATAVCQ